MIPVPSAAAVFSEAFAMFDKQAVIYAARTVQDAFLLRSLLSEEGIEAVVVNDALEGGSGVDIVGWPTSARVIVAEADTERARHIALVFDRKTAAAPHGRTTGRPDEPSPATVLDDWPRCPECDAPRSTRCPICGTAGHDFSPADSDFLDVLGPGAAAAAAGSCSCGPGGCSPELVPAGEAAAEHPPADASKPMLMCPTCDEPFVPEYLRRCEWCGHEFPDGTEIPLPSAPADPLNGRVVAVILAMLLLGVAMAGYFLYAF
jgi:hypothetical protein